MEHQNPKKIPDMGGHPATPIGAAFFALAAVICVSAVISSPYTPPIKRENTLGGEVERKILSEPNQPLYRINDSSVRTYLEQN